MDQEHLVNGANHHNPKSVRDSIDSDCHVGQNTRYRSKAVSTQRYSDSKKDKRCKMKSFNAIATAAFVGASLLTAQPALAACSSREVSYTSRVSVQFSVTNNRRYPVNVVWIDFEGIRKHYRTLRSGDTFSSSSYLSHVWIMEEASSNLCLSNIRLGAANQHLILR